jgi:hypothetical protein
MDVVGSNDISYPCQVYVAIPQEGITKPDRDYVELLISAAVDSGLPEDYIETLRARWIW